MKKALLYASTAIIVLAGAGLAWHYMGSAPGEAGEVDDFPLLCKHCNYFFALGEDEIYTHPKGPAGEGFKCEKCGKFGAVTARRCDTCKSWFSAEERGARCPRCNKGRPAERS